MAGMVGAWLFVGWVWLFVGAQESGAADVVAPLFFKVFLIRSMVA